MTPPAARGLILTAGQGTRLRPLTDDRAKAAVPVAGSPLIHRILRWAASQGLDNVVLNLHHQPQTITSLVGDGASLGVRVRYSFERTLLGSAGGPRHALSLLDARRFFLVNGDTLTDLDLAGLERAHVASGASVTLAVVPHPAPGRYGGVLADPSGRVLGFVGRGHSDRGWHFIGVQLVDSRLFDELPDNQPASTIPDLYEQLIARKPGAVRVHPVTAVFHDVGTASDYLRTCLAIAAAEAGASLRGEGCAIDPSATVVKSVLWDRVQIGRGAVLSECVVGDEVRIPAGMRLERRVVVAAGPGRPAAGDTVVGDLLVAPLGEGTILC